MHEIMHAIGFWHEQSRPDRNLYVEVLWENILDGTYANIISTVNRVRVKVWCWTECMLLTCTQWQ